MDERVRFVARLLEGEKIAVVCREFGISRKTGHRIFNHTKTCGSLPRSHRAHHHCGRICIGKRKFNLSRVFAGETVGIREVSDQVWLVSFMDYELGFFDEEENRVEPAHNPLSPM